VCVCVVLCTPAYKGKSLLFRDPLYRTNIGERSSTLYARIWKPETSWERTW